MTEKNETQIDVSLIIPVFNGAKWVEKCFPPILKQVSYSRHVNHHFLSIFHNIEKVQ